MDDKKLREFLDLMDVAITNRNRGVTTSIHIYKHIKRLRIELGLKTELESILRRNKEYA